MENQLILVSFKTGLDSVYAAEIHTHCALEKISSAVSSIVLADIIKRYSEQANQHTKKIQNIFIMLQKAASNNYYQIDPWLDQCKESILKDLQKGTYLDRSIQALVEKVLLTKICTYNVLLSYAQSVQLDFVCDILQNIIQEENTILSELMEVHVPILNIEIDQSFHLN
jgi:ferritin-like metal-binding protein YciE